MTTTRIRKIAATLIALTLAGGIVASLPAEAATPETRYVTVNSQGSIKVTPDAVRLNAIVSFVAGSNKEALAKVSTVGAAVRAALTKSGILKGDIATQSITVYPEYNYTQDKGSVIIGYRATQSFTVIIRKAESAGKVIESVVSAGNESVAINGIAPFISKGSAAMQEARAAAVADAKSKASSYAKLLGTSLGKVISLQENSAPSYSFPMLGVAKAEDASTPVIDLGEEEVSISITVKWALN